jgi:hypothetical protein
MSKIADYNPLRSVKIPGVSGPIEVEAKGLVVIVGPNSSGKTRLLRDIETTLTGIGQDPVVCQEAYLQRPEDCAVFLNDLLEQRMLEPNPGEPRERGSVRVASPYYGTGMRENRTFNLQAVEQDLYSKFANGWMAGARIEFFVTFGKVLLTSLFLENRLTLYLTQPRFDQHNQGPQNDLQALYMNRPAQKRLESETGRVFGNVVWLDKITAHSQLLLRVSGNSKPPPYEDQLDVDRAKTHRDLNDEGHGLKSYAGIAIALLLGRRPVCLIDEPELCLHPPQAYALGRFIGEYGTSEPHVTFVATHSSHTLRGILETASKLTILRLTNVDGKFKGYLVNDQDLRAAIKRPSTRTETVLDGIFSQAVAIVEAEGDRAVYQAAWEGIEHAFGREVHFVPVHGTGGISEICKFYRSLSIPVAIIADLDVVTEKPKMTFFVNELAAVDEATAVVQLCRNVEEALRRIPPTITEQEVIQELEQIKGAVATWANRDDIAVHEKLSTLRNRIDRLHELKSKGTEAFSASSQVRQDLEQIIQRCKVIGLFLVPCGQLENWVPYLMQGVSKRYKAQWADEAARRIQDSATKTGDIWDFVRSVTTFLQHQAKSQPSNGVQGGA